ncbi:MAG: hypothetical protein AABW64_02295 [Nanoarchaeota archaeon]
MIVDREKVTIDKKIGSKLYCIADVPPGRYACKFIKGNDMLAIRRVP